KSYALVLTAPGALEGRVVDAKTQRVLPRVKIETRSDRGERRVVRSGPDGRYKVRSLAPGRLKVTADDPRYVSYVKTQVAINAGETRKLDLPLTLGATVSGRVVDESGAPVADAKGAFGRSRDRDPMAMLRMRFEGGLDALGKTFRTKIDGSYKLTRLAPGDNQTLALKHPEYEKGQLTGLALEGGQTKTGVNLTLRRGFSIGGVVVDRDGNPVPFADVEIQTDGTVRMGRGGAVAMMSVVGLADRAPVQTGADGRFEAKGLAPGSYDVVASKKGWVRAEPVKVAVGEDKSAEPVRITLGPGAVIAGFVRSKNGTPLESVLVNARLAGSGGMGPRGGGGFSEPTGPDGAFYIESLKPGETYEVSLFEPTRIMAGPPAGGRKITAPAENVDLEGTGKGRISGIAVDLETGRPIEEFTVTYEADRGPSGQMFRMVTLGGGRRGMGPEKIEVKSPDGAFTLEDVTAGTWRVVVEAKGYQAGRTGGVVVEEGGQRDGVEVKLAAGRVLRGRVTDAKTGRPVPDANVNARLAGGERNPMAMFSEEGELLSTDADGRFEIPGLSPGKYQVTAKHTDYADASEITEVGDKGGNAELRLSTGGVIAGVVLSESRQPLPNVDVNLEPAGQGGGPFSFGGGGNSGTTDSAGRFRFTHLLPGRHSVRASVRSRSSSPVEVVLQEGESKEDVTIQLEAGATVRGLVSGLPTDQLKGVSISASGRDGYYASASTGADGRFELTGAPAGNLSVSATAGDFMTSTRRATKSVEIAEGARDAEVEVAFESGFQLTGRILRSGRGVSGARVFANRAGASGSATADSGGDYRIEGLAKGTYTVSVSSAEGSKTESVTLDGDQSLDFELGAAKITGSVVEDGTGRPLADAVIESAPVDAQQTGGGMMRMTSTTDTNGRFTLDNLDAKPYRLTARKAGFQYETKDVTADAGGAEIKLELKRGEGIGLRARDGIYNVPLRGLFARAFDAANNAVYSGSVPLDSEGRGEVPSLKPGRYTLVLDPDGYAPVTLEGVSAPSSETPVTFTPGGAVEIRSGAETQGKALAGAKARLLRGGQPYRWSPFSVNGEIGLQAAQRRLDNVAPGAYTLQIDGGASKSFNVTEGGTVVVDMP
ncbi:MAG: carboxypeptidase regulatory-like domain-containing protein, partial [Acidobacteria bacterium]|nr:carboxypeptidase regulatory-like domain-containing protein [Acidobacteriota bacterium]